MTLDIACRLVSIGKANNQFYLESAVLGFDAPTRLIETRSGHGNRGSIRQSRVPMSKGQCPNDSLLLRLSHANNGRMQSRRQTKLVYEHTLGWRPLLDPRLKAIAIRLEAIEVRFHLSMTSTFESKTDQTLPQSQSTVSHIHSRQWHLG